MAAPTNTVWGNIITGDKSTRQGQIGVSATVTNGTTSVSIKVEVWFKSRYSIYDYNNSFYYDSNATSATTLIGSVSIAHDNDGDGGWSTDNQTLLGEYTVSYSKTTTTQTKSFSAKFTGLDNLGESNVMTATATVPIPTLLPFPITYDSNGGIGAPNSHTKYYGVKTTLSTVVPTQTGYTFRYWNTQADGSGTSYSPGQQYTANASLTLYAIWDAITYTVSYNANGGSGAPGNQTKKHGVALTLSSVIPTRTNYTFKGWATSTTGAVTYSAGTRYAVNANLTLYAVWELAYIKPRMWGVTVVRCNKDGSANNSGIYASLAFNWVTDREASSVIIDWWSETASSGSKTFNISGTSGIPSYIVGGALSADSTYTIKITVIDELDESYIFSTLPGSKFVIDILEDVGVAFGKPAELEGVADFGYKARFNEGFMPIVLPPETDLNTVFTPNTYIGANISASEYLNCPVTDGTFTLIVNSGGEHGQARQEFISCDMSRPRRFVRFYHTLSTGVQGWGDWLDGSSEEVVLYENSTGTAGSIILPPIYYKYLEIYYTDNNGIKGGYAKINDLANGNLISLDIHEISSGVVYFRQSKYQIADGGMGDITLAFVAGSYLSFNTANGTHSYNISNNYIKIKKVVGRA